MKATTQKQVSQVQACCSQAPGANSSYGASDVWPNVKMPETKTGSAGGGTRVQQSGIARCALGSYPRTLFAQCFCQFVDPAVWEETLSLDEWLNVQRNWMYLEQLGGIPRIRRRTKGSRLTRQTSGARSRTERMGRTSEISETSGHFSSMLRPLQPPSEACPNHRGRC